MPGHTDYNPKPNLAFAKIVATPTDTSWSQVYNAGSIFICVSLVREGADESSLQAIGKNIFNYFEAEYYTLEERNLSGIIDAVKKSLEHIPPTVTVDFCLAHFKDNILYLIISGAGKILMKRDGKTGTLLEKKVQSNTIVSASGYLKNHDTIILETAQFAADVPDETVTSALDLALPNDIAEALSPGIHEKDDGGQAAIIIAYRGIAKVHDEEDKTIEEAHEESAVTQVEEAEKEHQEEKKVTLPSFSQVVPKFKLPSFRISHTKKVILSVAIILIVLLIASIFLTKKKQQDTVDNSLFKSVYTSAQKNYDEGKALEGLNKSLSQEDYQKAKKILEDNKNKFKPGSPEEKQINDLLTQVNAKLSGETPAEPGNLKEAGSETSTFLKVIQETSNGISFAQDSDTIYILTDKTISTVDKATNKKKEVIKNNGDWKNAVAIAPYQGNIYVLDRKNGVIKYMASDEGYGKTSYFKGSVPDLSQAASMAIDSPVWILLENGTIQKYIRGQAESFKVTGLDSPFSNPKKIFTDSGTDNLYILDPKNSRIVSLSKDGVFQKSYKASILKEAKNIEVLEQDNKILILANGKIWELPMNE